MPKDKQIPKQTKETNAINDLNPIPHSGRTLLRVDQFNVIGIGIKVTIKMIKAMTANDFSFIVKGVIRS